MPGNLEIEVVPNHLLSETKRKEIVSLCNQAFQEDVETFFSTLSGATHILGHLHGLLVSHAMWVTRWLQYGDRSPLRTAYVEFVATTAHFRRLGFGSTIMQRLAKEIVDYELGALCPAEPSLYLKLGWIFWRGPLYIRTPKGLIPTPDEKIMILNLPKTPVLNLDEPLSAEWREGDLW